jgi:hypothetical protein
MSNMRTVKILFVTGKTVASVISTRVKGIWTMMLITQPMPFIITFLCHVERALRKFDPQARLSTRQKGYLGFCLYAICLTNSICWAKFERASLGRYTVQALSWMFRHSKIPWELLVASGVRAIFETYGITEGIAVVDELDRQRSKRTKRLYKRHKMKDKKTGGFFMGQCLVFLVIVTPVVTIPVGFRFYQPDPEVTAWRREERRLKKAKVPASERPSRPPRNPAYPSKHELALALLTEFRTFFPDFTVTCCVADALYGTRAFLDAASAVFGGIQVISQAQCTQNVRDRTTILHVNTYFTRYPGAVHTINVRGGKTIPVTMSSARIHVMTHATKRFLVALQYTDDQNARYLMASDLSWRTRDIAQAYTYRWLVEVFFQDWMASEGWGRKSSQFDEEGACRSVILSLLLDHSLCFYPAQQARLEHKLPAYTVGSLCEKIQVESLVVMVQEILTSDDPEAQVLRLTDLIEEVYTLRLSTKHLSGREMRPLAPSPSLLLKYPHNADNKAA